MKNKALILIITLALFITTAISFFPVKSSAALNNMGVTEYERKMESFIFDARWTNGKSWGEVDPSLTSTAYAQDFIEYIYGASSLDAGSYYDDTSKISTGDVVFYTDAAGSERAFVVLKRDGNNLYTAEGDYDGAVRIQSPGYVISRGNLCIVLTDGSKENLGIIKYGYHYSNLAHSSSAF